MAGLADTDDPKVLIPGNVSLITERFYALQDLATALHEAGDGLAKIDTTEYWQGEAAETFRAAYTGVPSRWTTAGDCFSDVATALDNYSWTLNWAQQKATDAIAEWARGNAQTQADQNAHSAMVQQANDQAARTGIPQAIPAFVDTGEPIRQAAQDSLGEARHQLSDVEQTTLTKIRDACQPAPPAPTFLDHLGDDLSKLGRGLENLGIDAVNGLASFGNAMFHHPGEAAALLGGILAMGLGAGGEVGGTALDLTGVGAVIGVPVNILTGAVIAGGAAAAGAAGSALIMHAATDSQITVLQQQAAPSAPGSAGRSGTPTDRAKEHLTQQDLDAARRELNGETVSTKSTGTPFDHVQEVRETQWKLANRIQQLRRMLGDSRLDATSKAAAQSELSEASRLLDASKGYVPYIPHK